MCGKSSQNCRRPIHVRIKVSRTHRGVVGMLNTSCNSGAGADDDLLNILISEIVEACCGRAESVEGVLEELNSFSASQ